MFNTLQPAGGGFIFCSGMLEGKSTYWILNCSMTFLFIIFSTNSACIHVCMLPPRAISE